VILGRTDTTKTPWPISQQIVDAVEALHSDSRRLISPLTRNPNIAMVKAEVQGTRMSAGVQVPDIVNGLKRAHRRRVRELCTHALCGVPPI
jgi:hypothetical protein